MHNVPLKLQHALFNANLITITLQQTLDNMNCPTCKLQHDLWTNETFVPNLMYQVQDYNNLTMIVMGLKG